MNTEKITRISFFRSKALLVPALLISLLLLLPVSPVHAASAKASAIKAYRKFLSKKTIKILPGGTKLAEDADIVFKYKSTKASRADFALAYLNKDSIPELLVVDHSIYCGTSYSAGMAIFTWKNKKVKRLACIQGGGPVEYSWWALKKAGYYKKKGILVLNEAISEGTAKEYLTLKGTKLTNPLYSATFYGTTDYRSEGKTLSKSQFRKRLKKLTKGKKATTLKFHKNRSQNRAKYLR